MKKVFLVYLIILFVFLSAIGSAVYYFVFTQAGAERTIDYFKPQLIQAQVVKIPEVEGSLWDGILFENIELINLKGLPTDSSLSVQRVHIFVEKKWPFTFKVNIENGKIVLPSSEPIIFYGAIENGNVDVNVFSFRVNIEHIMPILDTDDDILPLKGYLESVDLRLRGTLDRLTITGTAKAPTFGYKTFTLENTNAKADLVVRKPESQRLNGTIFLFEGKMRSRGVAIDIQEGRIHFAGKPQEPRFDFRGISQVGNTLIRISLSGDLNDPQMELSSIPPKSQDQLLLMLVTGKEWRGMETSVDENRLAPELVQDFVDYFVFSGSGEKMGKKFGIRDTFFTFDESEKGVGFKKDITSRLGLGYAIWQLGEEGQEYTYRHKLLGDYEIFDNVWVEVEKRVNLGTEAEVKELDELDPKTSTKSSSYLDDKILLKYKVGF